MQHVSMPTILCKGMVRDDNDWQPVSTPELAEPGSMQRQTVFPNISLWFILEVGPITGHKLKAADI